MKVRVLLAICLLVAGMVACSTPHDTSSAGGKQATGDEPRHVKVYFEKGMFGGWPANHGIWSWGDEILVGFGMGYYKDQGQNHHIDREKPEIPMLARSLDGGETWSIEDPGAKGYLLTEGGYLHGVTRPGVTIPPLRDSEGGIDFHPPGLRPHPFAPAAFTPESAAFSIPMTGAAPGTDPSACRASGRPALPPAPTTSLTTSRLARFSSRLQRPTEGRGGRFACAPPTPARPGNSFPGSGRSPKGSPSCRPRFGFPKRTFW